MSTDIYHGREMNVAIAGVYCERCGRRTTCFYVISHKPYFPNEKVLKLCLDRCWIELCNAVRDRRTVIPEDLDDNAPARPVGS